MISREKQKFIRSLQDKKTRQEHGLFLVEGEKSIIELINSNFIVKNLFVTKKFEEKYKNELKKSSYEIGEDDIIEKLSAIKSNNSGIAIVESPKNKKLTLENHEYVVVLDNINDPGNLGTIIRICDFYGIKKIITSRETVELTNPKVISSTMGSISRIKVYYTDLEEYFESNTFPVYGTYLEGEDIHKIDFDIKGGFIVIGSESHGISKNLEKYITKKITIPRIGQAESLNAGVACGIVIDNVFRKK